MMRRALILLTACFLVAPRDSRADDLTRKIAATRKRVPGSEADDRA